MKLKDLKVGQTLITNNKDKEQFINIIKESKAKKPMDLFKEKDFEKLFNKLNMTFTELNELLRIYNRKLA